MRHGSLHFCVTLVAATFIALALSVGGPAIAGHTLVVDDDGFASPGNCDALAAADSSTISGAVAAAHNGATIEVCPGVYPEQVTLAGFTSLTLKSTKPAPLGAIIQAPAGALPDPKAIVRVNGATGVTIDGFVITGPGSAGCDSLRYGVRVDLSGSATIKNNYIIHIRDNPFSGCQNGVGVLVGRKFEAQTGIAVIQDNLISEYQKGGIVVDNDGSSASIIGNIIIGKGATTVIAQNGIQISRGAVANAVSGNIVSRNDYTPTTFTATGILLFAADPATNPNIGRNGFFANEIDILRFASEQAQPFNP